MTQPTSLPTGPGWAKLWAPIVELADIHHIPILQIKEKFGGLRIYVGDTSLYPALPALISAVESASYHTCEECGEDGISRWDPDQKKLIWNAHADRPGYNWRKTYCDPCRLKIDVERQITPPTTPDGDV